MRRLVQCVVVMVLGLCTSACTPQDTVVKLYEEPGDTVREYNRLLIVSISSDAQRRKTFEEEIVRQLRRFSVEAFTSYNDLEYKDGVSARDVGELSKAKNTDGFLLLHIVSADTTVEASEGKEEIIPTCRGGDPFNYFLYDYTVLEEPDTFKISHTVAVESSLYDTQTTDRVWSIRSTCFKKSSIADALQKEAELIVRQLRTDELI